MTEIKTKLETFRVDYLCHECSVPIESVGGFRNSRGEKWHHTCHKCKKVYDFDYNIKYPRIEYVEVKND